jgi:YVTN family beta-propeller protein
MKSTLAASLLLAAFPLAAGTLLVANKSDHTVDLLDDAGVSRARLQTGHAPHEIAVSPDGATAVVANYGDRQKAGSTLTVVDVAKANVVRTIELAPHTRPHGVAWIDGERLAVTTEGSKHLLIVDVGAGKVTGAIETGQEVSHMVALAAGRAFVANIGSGSVTAIDLASAKKLADVKTGAGAEGIAVRPGTSEVWVTNRAADTLSVVDAETLEVTATIEAAGFPIRVAFTPDGKRALVSAARTGEVILFDAAGRRELRRAKLDLTTAPDAAQRLFGDQFGKSPVPVGLLVSPDGRSAFVAATQADAVVVIDTATLAVRNLLRAGREPDGMALSSAEAAAPADIRGAWQLARSDGATETLIVTEGHFARAHYRKDPAKFVSTTGGSWTWEEDGTARIAIEFDTANPDRVGTTEAVPLRVSANEMVIGEARWLRVDDGTSGALEGAWLMTGRKRDGEIATRRPGARRTMKILSGTRFQWIAYNVETKEFFGSGGGTYTTADGAYTETIEFFSRDDARAGRSLAFRYSTPEGVWHHEGKSTAGEPMYEVWERREALGI